MAQWVGGFMVDFSWHLRNSFSLKIRKSSPKSWRTWASGDFCRTLLFSLALPVSPTIPSLDYFKIQGKVETGNPYIFDDEKQWFLAFPVKMFPSINSMIPLFFRPIFPTKTIPSWSKPAPFRAPGSPSSVLSVSWARPLGTGIGKLGQPREPWEINKNQWKLMEIDGNWWSWNQHKGRSMSRIHAGTSVKLLYYAIFMSHSSQVAKPSWGMTTKPSSEFLFFCWQSFKIPCQSFF